MSAPQEPAPTFYTKDQLLVQVELIEAIDIRFLPILQAIFSTGEWLWQSQPIPRKLIKALCLKDPLTDRFTCVFCPDRTFNQSGHTIEHIQQHFGLRPFHCTAPNWYGLSAHHRRVSAAEKVFLVRRPSCVRTSSKITPALMLSPAVSHVPITGKSGRAPFFGSFIDCHTVGRTSPAVSQGTSIVIFAKIVAFKTRSRPL